MINNSEFKIKEYPKFDPIINEWARKEWWDVHMRRIFEGHWVSGKWMPGELYYYVNFHKIIIEKGIYRGLGLPMLRDIDWEKFYIYTEAIGFSGFEYDDEYSCHRAILDLAAEKISKERIIKKFCTDADMNIVQTGINNIWKKNGKLKTYIPASEYLQKIHKQQLGKPLYFNEAKHVLELASRGYGKSFSGAGLIWHNYRTGGIHDYDLNQQLLKDGEPSKSETNVGAIDAKYSGDLLSKVKSASTNFFDSHLVRIGNQVETFRSPLQMDHEGSLAASSTLTSLYNGSQIHHRTFADDPLIFNGTRPNRMFIDEVGFANNILQLWEGVEASQAAAAFKRLTLWGMGTGGLTTGGAAMHTYDIFYNPQEFNCLAFEDDWEGKGKIGYFVPATKALNEFKEGPNLVSNQELALEVIEEERAIAKKAPQRTKYIGTVINKPITHSEIFLRMEGTFFPIQDLKITLSELESVKSNSGATYKYDLSIKDGKVVPSISEKPVIREFPLRKGLDMDGCIEIFQLPKKDANGQVFKNRYIAGWDPIVNDGNEDTSRSLQSVFIFDIWTDSIVAEYTARTYLAEEYYEQARRLLMFYSAVCNYESNIKGPYAYFKNKNSLYLLVETPEILKDQNFVKGSSIGNKSLGTNTNDAIITWSLNLILGWLEKQAYGSDNNEIKNISRIMSHGLLQELIQFSRDTNCDRVSALAMVMILREDRARFTDMVKSQSVKSKNNDKFWDKAYKGKKANYSSLRF